MRDDHGGGRSRAQGGRLLTVLCATGVALAVGAASLRVLGTGDERWSFAALSFTPYALVGAGLLVLLGLATRRWASCAGATLAVLRERASTRSTTYHWQPAAVVELPGAAEMEVVAVHTAAPVGKVSPARWRAEITGLPRPLPGAATRLLVGDFNATLDHQPLRDLLGTGYRDAADTLGRGLRATWPTERAFAPVAAIDHVLVEQSCEVRSFETVTVAGADHRAVVAELVLPG